MEMDTEPAARFSLISEHACSGEPVLGFSPTSAFIPELEESLPIDSVTPSLNRMQQAGEDPRYTFRVVGDFVGNRETYTGSCTLEMWCRSWHTQILYCRFAPLDANMFDHFQKKASSPRCKKQATAVFCHPSEFCCIQRPHQSAVFAVETEFSWLTKDKQGDGVNRRYTIKKSDGKAIHKEILLSLIHI